MPLLCRSNDKRNVIHNLHFRRPAPKLFETFSHNIFWFFLLYLVVDCFVRTSEKIELACNSTLLHFSASIFKTASSRWFLKCRSESMSSDLLNIEALPYIHGSLLSKFCHFHVG